jgi:hypothetical protein
MHSEKRDKTEKKKAVSEIGKQIHNGQKEKLSN